MKTRTAILKDLDEVYSLERKWKAEDISPNMQESSKKEIQKAIEEERVLVAEENTKIIGFLLFELHGNYCELDSMYVNKEIRKKGIGKELMKTFLSLPKIKKCKMLSLHADSKKENKLVKFYEQFGFKRIAVLMRKEQVRKNKF